MSTFMKIKYPPQHQARPGVQEKMRPQPDSEGKWYQGSGKLLGKTAIITGGDSGIGRAVATFFAREGADVCILYYSEHQDAEDTRHMVEEEGQRCLTIAGDVGDSAFCREAVDRAAAEFGHLDVLVNNAAYQQVHDDLEKISDRDIETTFRTNIFSYFYMTRAALKHLKEDAAIINTTSVTAYAGHPTLVDYASTKAAIVGFTRSLALNLAPKKIRVNGVAPGPIWTPLIVSGFSPQKVSEFGQDKPLERAGQPVEVAPSYVFLASRDSSYMTGQVLHPNGGTVING